MSDKAVSKKISFLLGHENYNIQSKDYIFSIFGHADDFYTQKMRNPIDIFQLECWFP